MIKYIIIAAILLASTVASAADTLYYTTNGTEVIYSIPDWINSKNPKCAENGKLYTKAYDKGATDGKTCWRWRPWVCIETREQGADVEPLPLSFCSKK